jgi:hypothetical protein
MDYTVGDSRHEVVGGVDDVHPSRNGQERGGRPVILSALEMEDEEEDFDDELLDEVTGDGGLRRENQGFLMSSRLKHRKKATTTTSRDAESSSFVMGVVRDMLSGQFTWKHVVVLIGLSVVTFMLISLLNKTVEDEFEIMESGDQIRKGPHRPSLGGTSNVLAFPRPNWFYGTDCLDDNNVLNETCQADSTKNHGYDDMPMSNIGQSVYSVSRINKENHIGHYLHDPDISPYSVHGYDRSKSSMPDGKKVQKDFDQKKKDVNETYGEWKSPYFDHLLNHSVDYTKYPHRDVPADAFSTTHKYAWQNDLAYLRVFISEATDLIKRMKTGIRKEYGIDNAKDAELPFKIHRDQDEYKVRTIDGAGLNPKQYAGDQHVHNAERDSDHPLLSGIAYLNKNAWDGLVLKLWHAVMTEDNFFVVTTGPASGNTVLAQDGNLNFQQTAIQQFHYIMEPVLDKLGVTLISRNMGMPGASTTVAAALGGVAPVYGESDILWYQADPRAYVNSSTIRLETTGQLDLLHKQAIMSGERMPILLTPNPGELLADTFGQAWIGNIQPGVPDGICKDSANVPACDYLTCDASDHDCAVPPVNTAGKRRGVPESVCWVPRTDYKPKKSQLQHVPQPTLPKGIPGVAEAIDTQGLPNIQKIRLESRKLAMLVLEALGEVFDRWMVEVTNERLPLSESLWHVGTPYNNIREIVRVARPSFEVAGSSGGENLEERAKTPCEEFLAPLDPNICHVSMNVLTAWTPRVMPLKHQLADAVGLDLATIRGAEVYDKLDLLPYQWNIPVGSVDIHMIALATSRQSHPAPDDSGAGDGSSDDADGGAPAAAAGTDEQDSSANDDGERRLADSEARRKLAESDKIPSSSTSVSGWTIPYIPAGFCDGSSQSRCNRAADNSCLLSNYNFFPSSLRGTPDSNKLRMNFDLVEGMLFASMSWKPLASIPDDFELSYTIKGRMWKLNKERFEQRGVKLLDDLWVFPFYIDPKMMLGTGAKQTVAFALSFTCPSSPNFELIISHFYFA